MPRHREPAVFPERECEAPDCTVRFTPERSTARYHSATCRQRAGRARKAAEAEAVAKKSEGEGNPAEHTLVTAVRKELARANALDTVSGQLALQFARRIVNPDEAGLTNLSKELRSLLAEAKASVAPVGAAPPSAPAEDDEVKRARETRERKARQASAR